MRSVLGLALIGWSLAFAHGLVRRLLPGPRLDTLTTVLATGAIGLGLLTLVALWLMVALPGTPVLATTVGVSIAVFAIDRLAGSGSESGAGRPAIASGRPVSPCGPTVVSATLLAGIAACCAAIVFNAVYWPFDVGDALALYAPFGKHIYEAATLPLGDRLYDAYPMLVPMAFALTHWASGGVNEYVARLVPALMAVGAIGAAGALGRAAGSACTGLVASLLVAVTPIFGRWASTGYTDVPAALYVGLTALFAWHWWTTGDRRALVLTGIAAGLAMWTKNSALALVPSLAWLVVWRSYAHRTPSASPWASTWRPALTLAATVLAVAGPWYLRNLLVFGFLVPPTMLTDRAAHDLGSLVTMLAGDQHFGVSGWVFTAAIPYGAFALVSGRHRAQWHILLAFAVPYVAAWWWLASYEARFLMTIVPVLAVMGSLMLADIGVALTPRLTPSQLRLAWIVGVAVSVAASAVALRKIVEHKSVLVRQPFLDDAERHRVRLGGLYDLAVALNDLPVGSRVAGVPAILRYHLRVERFGVVDYGSATGPPEALGEAYDYAVYRAAEGVALPWRTAATPDLRTVDGYLLYPTRARPTPHAPDDGI